MIYDINLLPKNNRNTSKKIEQKMIFTGILFVIILVACFYLFPLQQKLFFNKKIQEQNNLIDSYASVQKNYSDLTDRINNINSNMSTLKSIRNDRKDLSALLNDIEKRIPSNTKLNSMQLEDGRLVIEGDTSTFKEIAQFIVNLRSSEEVEEVTFTTATKQEDNTVLATQKLYSFTLNVKYKYSDILKNSQENVQAGIGGGKN